MESTKFIDPLKFKFVVVGQKMSSFRPLSTSPHHFHHLKQAHHPSRGETTNTMGHARLTNALIQCLIFSSLFASVCGKNLRRVSQARGSSKKLKKKSGTKKSQKGRYPANGNMHPYMKYRPPAYKPWSMNVFQIPNQQSQKSMSTKLWMNKGKGYPTSKGTTFNMNWSKGKGFGNEVWKGKGITTKGDSIRSGKNQTCCRHKDSNI